MAHFLELIRQGLEVKDEVDNSQDEVDNSQWPIFTHKHFRPQHLVKACEVDEVAIRSYVSFICKNIQGAKTQLG